MTYGRLILSALVTVWLAGVLAVAVVANALRLREGPTVLVIDAARGWGLHRMDLTLLGVALLPLLVVAVASVLSRLARTT